MPRDGISPPSSRMRRRTPPEARTGSRRSLLDRILGEGDAQSVRTELIRDLEWLLNSRSHYSSQGDGYAHLERSAYAYGLRDIGSYAATATNAAALCREIRETVETFEPRLKNVTVNQVETQKDKPASISSLCLMLTGELETDSGPQQIALETWLELSNGKYQIRGDRS